ncbi:PadR family transcriptional regulator [Lactobacillus panisapium]|uniref:PadR family transcriptional regulator n=1 Tax=Lactobacillus panisapium TaxID=2012495 RepID=A0ABX8WAF2_9LACO|nr:MULTISPECIES: helix-turn-helix transcriptional regulator [Lactobacillus]MCO6534145.1 PadR family transcriptional regulator [Lactobacillus sp.]QYN53727.1 PadR family transcriptional regulator [Lactobacillus panisapium]QYN55470.1 PadR family transcriptional regulator [Lactobacillus panisapium]QYN59496.1 PadR family transcriptional regulator [Lactobacillus panisapium]
MNKQQNALTEAYYYILLSLFKPLHGYGIMKKIATMTNGRINIAAGTLYGALSKLEQYQWISALPTSSSEQRKQYIITDKGKDVILAEFKRLKELVKNGHLIIEGENQNGKETN